MVITKKGTQTIKINQKSWLKPYIDMNTELRKKAKNDFEKDIFKLITNSVFKKVLKIFDGIEILIQSLNKTITSFSQKICFLQKITLINKSIYLGLSIYDLSKTVMYEFWCDYVKPKYGEKQNTAIWILTVSLSTQKQMIFMKT